MTAQDLALLIRRDAVEMAHVSKISHIGSALSCADIIAALYGGVMRLDPSDPRRPDRDRFILSKGHASMALYAALAARGFFPREWLWTQGQPGSRLSGHVSHDLPGVELATGSLGMGLSVACGMALAGLRTGRDYRVFVLMGDGECAEGSVWEAALFAGQNKLRNLVAIVDNNGLQANDSCDNVISWRSMPDIWRACGWKVAEGDGHDMDFLQRALTEASPDMPTCVVAHTVKGKGVSFMENQKIWHHLSPQGQDYETARRELGMDGGEWEGRA